MGNTYLEDTYSEIYPNISQDEAGLRKLFIQFSFPGGIPSHVSPECPGSIHEGGELGYSLRHSEQGRLKPELAELAPQGERRMGSNPHANGGILLRDLRMPDFRDLRGRRSLTGSARHRRHACARAFPARCDEAEQ